VQLTDLAPTKIVAVHLSYTSRAAERGRTPQFPSYFLKPTSSFAPGGGEVVRPDGCELLAFEGEIALVIGTRARRVSVAEGWGHVGWVTAANDLGVYDLRYADGGSNVRSKGADGFTPIGPELLDAHTVDPDRLQLRTWVNGALAQDATTGDELIFGFGRIVADLSRLMTLEPGDVILTGTPTGSSVVQPGDVVEVEVRGAPDGPSSGRLASTVVQDRRALEPIGAMPRADAAARAAAYGAARSADPVSDDVRQMLGVVSTATLSSQLRKRGLNGCTLSGVAPLRPGVRMCGRARTVAYLPLREDLFAQRGGGFNAQKQAVEALRPGEVLVIGARGVVDAGTVGDILALRAQRRGAVGVVTDGAVRDRDALAGMDLPVYAGGAHPAVLGHRHVPWAIDVAVACGNSLVQPGDLLVGDSDGVVVVPDAIAAELAADAVEQERQERFITERVADGAAVDGLYPMEPRWREAYDEWVARAEGP
jgi:regulator of RNase E activity RraA/2-keto-4-pentenoate hydratase/2-oxohepta-3-ene-1,7-dioic acid hydratase in catechol pathway